MADQIEAARTEPSEIIRPTYPGARFAAGTVAGVIGGVLMMGLLMAYGNAKGGDLTAPVKEMGAFVYGIEALVLGSKAIMAGALIQIGVAILIGVFFAQFVSRGTSTFAALCGGIALSIAIWLAMDLIVLPYENPTMAARVALMPLQYFGAHLLYGFGLGTTPAFIRMFTKESSTHRMVRTARTQPILMQRSR
jgi:hypothetical protein